MSVFSTCGLILRLAVALGLLVSIHPALALLAVFAVPTVLDVDLASRRRARRGGEGARSGRLARHLFLTATTAAPGKEVRVTRIGPRLVARPARGLGALVRARGIRPLAQRVVARAGLDDLRRPRYVGADRVGRGRLAGARGLGAAGARGRRRGSRRTSAPPSARSASCAASGSTARGGWRGSRTTRRRWPAPATRPRPRALRDGIRLDGVSFAYPGTDRLVLERRSISTCPRARSSRWWARTAPARRRS